MSTNKEYLIFVFDLKGLRKFKFTDRLSLGLGKDESLADVLVGQEDDPCQLGYFQVQDGRLTYININSTMDTWINNNKLNENEGVVLRGEDHILLTKGEARFDGDFISLYLTENERRSEHPWQLLNVSDLKDKDLVNKLGVGQLYSSSREVYLRHKNIIAYQKLPRVVEKGSTRKTLALE